MAAKNSNTRRCTAIQEQNKSYMSMSISKDACGDVETTVFKTISGRVQIAGRRADSTRQQQSACSMRAPELQGQSLTVTNETRPGADSWESCRDWPIASPSYSTPNSHVLAAFTGGPEPEACTYPVHPSDSFSRQSAYLGLSSEGGETSKDNHGSSREPWCCDDMRLHLELPDSVHYCRARPCSGGLA